ncbi:hypothetical protein K501DRAFT_237609 [Backusella circina FSU 941]|nr:hypothetical protein K501DRAFT_237609 [Backusella circina FSU 941]
MTNSSTIRDYLPQSQHVNLQTTTGDTKIDTLTAIFNQTTKAAYILNTGGSIWGLDFCPKRPSNDTQPELQYLAIGGYNTTTETHTKPQVVGEYKNAIQIWRCDMFFPGGSPSLDLCLLHDYGIVMDLKWCPLGSYEENAGCDSWSKLGILSVLFGDGVVRICVIPHPNALRKKKGKSETIFLRIRKPRLTFKLERSVISCQDWSGYLRLACGGCDGSITIWDIEQSFKQQKPVIHVKIYDNNGVSTINSISWYSILDSCLFISTNDQSSMNVHNIKDPYIPNNVSSIGHPYSIVSWPGHRQGYMWTSAASVSRLVNSIGDRVNRVMTDHNGYLWSMDTCAYHEWVVTSGSEGCVYSKKYTKIGKKSYQNNIYQLTYDQNTNTFKYLEHGLIETKPKEHNYHAVLADQICSIHKVVWNPNIATAGWIASGGKGGICRIEFAAW